MKKFLNSVVIAFTTLLAVLVANKTIFATGVGVNPMLAWWVVSFAGAIVGEFVIDIIKGMKLRMDIIKIGEKVNKEAKKKKENEEKKDNTVANQ